MALVALPSWFVRSALSALTLRCYRATYIHGIFTFFLSLYLLQLDFAQELEPHFHATGPIVPGTNGASGFDDERLFPVALAMALKRPQVMSSSRERLVESVCSLLERGVGLVLEYNEGHPDFPLPAVRKRIPLYRKYVCVFRVCFKVHILLSFFSSPVTRYLIYLFWHSQLFWLLVLPGQLRRSWFVLYCLVSQGFFLSKKRHLSCLV